MKSFFVIFLLAVLLFSLLPSVGAQDPAIYFDSDFESNTLPSEVELITENWSLEATTTSEGEATQALVGQSTDLEMLTLAGSEEWDSYYVLMLMRLTGDGIFLMSTHLDNNPDCLTGHTFGVIGEGGSGFATSTQADCTETPHDGVPISGFPMDEWVVLLAEVTPTSLVVLVNEEEWVNVKTPPMSEGSFSLALVDKLNIEIDFLTIVENTGTATSGNSTTSNTVSLEESGGEYQAAIDELVALDLIPKGGKLLFREDYAFFTGSGSWFTPLAQNAPRTNIVMAGELTFTAGGGEELEVCSLSSRINANQRGTAQTYLDMSFINDGSVAVLDRVEGEITAFQGADLRLDLDKPHHFLLILQDGEATLFVNGELAVDRLQVEERSGSYGISLLGKSANSKCEGRNIWVYDLD